MAENQSPRPANTPEHDKSKPILVGTQPLQQQDKVDSPPAPAKKDEPERSPQPGAAPEKKS
jgi:hypothetical protein